MSFRIGSVFQYLSKQCRVTQITKRYVHFEVVGTGIESQIERDCFIRVIQ